MATSSGRKTSSSSRSTGKKSSGKSGNRGSSTSSRKKVDAYQAQQDSILFHEIGLIVLFVAMVILFCCNFDIIGPVGNAISGVMFGLFGLTAYAAPILLFLAIAFWFANEGNPTALRKIIAGVVLFLMIGIVCELITKNAVILETYDIKAIYENCSTGKMGGGVLAGSLAFVLHRYLETIGTVLVVLLCSVVSIILLTERSLINSMKNGGDRIRERSRADAERRREYAEIRRQEQEKLRVRREEERRLRAEEKENDKILRMEKKVTGVMLDTSLKNQEEERRRDDIHEITFTEEYVEAPKTTKATGMDAFDFDKIQIRSAHQLTIEEHEPEEEHFDDGFAEEIKPKEPVLSHQAEQIRIHKEGISEVSAPAPKPHREVKRAEVSDSNTMSDIHMDIQSAEKKLPKKYMFPPLSRLQKGVASTGDSTRELKETAMRLQQTLHTFGVKVTITDISQGPSVTRYELQPEQGVKVSKIVNLADDIKLNLAATDIRIEAPIPGKAAIGIEVPNKENMAVALRDLFESKEFKEFDSNIAFAVGKDIAGKVVVADIAKMPHMLIAGATGSGKSVCINTLIMSILYKAHPDDVKLIMVDPKVVELSVYNGIPHLLIPVVTDPKKASAALHWGVSEMEDRYRKFADFNVRDLKGYNKKVESMRENGDETAPAKMPQIVIIVDELADLMMVCPGEVEESICRLAQLARAAGIHLIIATQRPSVDVITGLIKANMPSRVAFSVSSGVDSRTILDMNGAEKLLGKGDMLFYPQGYTKPARIQGAFVSDKEVSDVVDFLKNQAIGNTYAEDIEEKIKNIGTSSVSGGAGGGSARDDYFEEAGRFIIDKDKASIGMLQRVLKIGFNRAARIMDQLCEYGVVGEEEGTKPRKVLMSMEQFEQLLEEI
uniref:DNA translocase FtsK 4TM domain-containing protein n=1 Tax=Acetatifactor sp. TaxID=1872090 RepID=UPI0040560765